ncbi:unnamed protein product [Prorocentrum cordatum]|uniref:Uncharacterized protein n=1 Tax=Prorocentrum cordatum TaxID=2364126 RepID=A0ABN9UPP8_9DINO|nr:unnamed protein product [Polarella glacialis]
MRAQNMTTLAEPPPVLDARMAQHMDRMFPEGKAAGACAKLLAAAQYFAPAYGCRAEAVLPRAVRGLHGWRGHVPSRARRPLPRCAAAGIATAQMRKHRVERAPRWLLMMDAHLRHGELLALRPSQFLEPTSQRHMVDPAIILRPAEDGVPGKTGTADESSPANQQRLANVRRCEKRARIQDVFNGLRKGARSFCLASKESIEVELARLVGQLRGADPSGVKWTRRAAAYPRALATKLVTLFVDTAFQKEYEKRVVVACTGCCGGRALCMPWCSHATTLPAGGGILVGVPVFLDHRARSWGDKVTRPRWLRACLAASRARIRRHGHAMVIRWKPTLREVPRVVKKCPKAAAEHLQCLHENEGRTFNWEKELMMLEYLLSPENFSHVLILDAAT